ncbi:MAG: TetR family transcriptional regulator [Mucilaginibacter sp.]|nr:TetR family transcriptional regulator [Mucilaginibacter sp.]
MSKHHGSIIEYVVRKHGYNISDLARELDVNRRSIYNYFGSQILKPNVIFQIGRVIRHDFSKEFPEIFEAEEFQDAFDIQPKFGVESVLSTDEAEYKEKYLELLERYNELLTNIISNRDTLV